jgi:type IV pilus assembly protein PilX
MARNETVTPATRNQQGVALIIALIFLLLMNILAVAALSTTALGERMAGNLSDKNTAFQAAESALAGGEFWIGSQLNKPVFDPANTSDGLHLPSLSAVHVWEESTGVWSGNDVLTYTGLQGVSQQPRFIIEDLGMIADNKGSLVMPANYKSSGKNLFRITARGTGSSSNAVVMVQSTYEKRF